MAGVSTWELALVVGGSFFVCALLVMTQKWHGRHSLDHDLSGAQKIHQAPVPRIGGLGLAAGLLIGAGLSYMLDGMAFSIMLQLMVCALPCFFAGLVEDLTKKMSVKARLYASFASAAMAAYVLGIRLVRLDTPGLDTLVTITPLSILFTSFAVAGTTHAVNIIDGLNGLAAGSVSLMLAGLATIAWQIGDLTVLQLCLVGISALLGFLILNFPFGRIFLGDGGAYLAGFWLAECGLLLLKNNPGVSTWAVLLCCIYPVWETVFSMYRRHIVQRVSSGRPDMVHLHHLIYRRVSSWARRSASPTWFKHALSSGSLWLLGAVCPVVAAASYSHTPVLMTSTLIFIAFYNLAYKLILPARRTDMHQPDIAVQIKQP